MNEGRKEEHDSCESHKGSPQVLQRSFPPPGYGLRVCVHERM